MHRFVKAAGREENWVQAPGSAITPMKRKPGRPPETEEKKRARREEKAKNEENNKEKEDNEEKGKKKGKDEDKEKESLRMAVILRADELEKSAPEKAQSVQ